MVIFTVPQVDTAIDQPMPIGERDHTAFEGAGVFFNVLR